MSKFAFLIPLFPLGSFLVNIFFGRMLKKYSAYISILAIGISFLMGVIVFFEVLAGVRIDSSLSWLPFYEGFLTIGILIDELASIMLLVVSSVSLLVHIYSIGYMHGDIRYSRFFAYLSLFSCSMLGLVVANNYMLLYACWELVGLTSYLLISFWFEKKEAADAGKKAFITTKLGDVGMFVGILLLLLNVGSLHFGTIFEFAEEGHLNQEFIMVVCILLFCGAIGKSAQFPLHVWLPDAMEGPTPVSALIHAATMVAAGVYLVARSFPLFHLSAFAMQLVSFIGVLTAGMAASIALVQNDIKRVLAYSTISQLGYMMFGLGVGGYTAGVFHLFTHAFFKALLFLGAGSVIHAVQTNNIKEMGGLGVKMKITSLTFLIACLSISGIPPFAGFWSKDEILLEAYRNEHYLIFFLGVFFAMLTAFYMFRLYFVTFTGKYRGNAHPHESPYVMTIPLIILGFMSVVAGFPGSPFFGNGFHGFIHFEEGEIEGSGFVMTLSVSAGILGMFFAWLIYSKKIISRDFISRRIPQLYRTLFNKYYFDEIYLFLFVRPVIYFSKELGKFDLFVIDGGVNGTGFLTVILSKIQRAFDIYIVDGLVNFTGWITGKAGMIGRRIQTGLVQNYVLLLLFGVVIFVFFRVFLR